MHQVPGVGDGKATWCDGHGLFDQGTITFCLNWTIPAAAWYIEEEFEQNVFNIWDKMRCFGRRHEAILTEKKTGEIILVYTDKIMGSN